MVGKAFLWREIESLVITPTMLLHFFYFLFNMNVKAGWPLP